MKKTKMFIFVLLILSLIVGISGILIGRKINIGANIDTAMSALPFFSVGYILNKHSSILKENRYDKFNALFVLSLFFISWFCSLTGNVNYRLNSFEMMPVFVYVGGITGTLGILFLSKIFGSIPFVSYWGRYSIMILVTHQPMIGIYKRLCCIIGMNGYIAAYVSLIMIMMSYLIIIPLMKKYLSYVTAQKELIRV